MTTDLGTFQAAFVQALFAPHEVTDPAVRQLTKQPAFAVYRNTVMKGCIDALESNFPAVVRLVGSDWFRAVAAVHVTADPPRDGRLMRYGRAFPDFLAGFAPAADLAYLPGVAWLDTLWSDAHIAADAPLLDAAWLARCEPDQLARLVLKPHPAARWAWFADQPVFTIWQRNRVAHEGAHEEGDIAWHGEGALVTRPVDSVASREIGEAACAFLDACRAGRTLADSAERALGVNPETDLSLLLEVLLRAGTFAAASFNPPSIESTS